MVDQSLDVLASEMKGIAADIAEIKHTVRSVQTTQNLGREQAVRIEERLSATQEAMKRAFDKIGEVDGRVKLIEAEQPVTRLVTKWVIAGVVAVASMAGLQVWTVKTNADRPVVVVDRD